MTRTNWLRRGRGPPVTEPRLAHTGSVWLSAILPERRSYFGKDPCRHFHGSTTALAFAHSTSDWFY